MKSNIRTSVIALLLFVTFSCKKDAVSNTSASNSSADRTSESMTASLSPVSELVSPVGDWIYYYSWGCTGSYSSTTITINADGTFVTGEGYTGQWFDGRGIFSMIYDAPSRTTYSGTERLEKIVGISSTYIDLQGCFYFEQASGKSMKTTHVAGMPDATGKMSSTH